MKKLFVLLLALFVYTNVYAADTAVSNMTADTTPGTDSLINTIDDPGGTPASRKSTIGQILTDGNIPNDLTINSTAAITTTSTLSVTGAADAASLDTGQGANELYGMNQDVQTTDSPTFNAVTLTTDLTIPNGGTGASSFNDGYVVLGNGTGALQDLAVTTDGALIIGDGTTDPTTITAFTGSTGTLKHEQGGLEADVSGYTDGLYGQASGATADIDTEAELETALGSINVIVSTEIDSFSELDSLVADKALVNKADAAVITADWDFGGGGIEIENDTTLPGSCTEGQIFMDTDATSGQRIYGCESGTFVLQGGTGGSGTPGGSDTQIQFNDGGSFGGDSSLTWDKTNNILATEHILATGGIETSAHVLANTLKVSDFWFPTEDGTASDILVTNGVGQVRFDQIQPVEYHTIYLNASSAILDDSSPPGLAIVESTGSGTPRFRVADFDTSSDEILYWSGLAIPDDIRDSEDWYADVYWFANDTGSGEDVTWAIQVACTTEADTDAITEKGFDTTASTINEGINETGANRLILSTITIARSEQDSATCTANDDLMLRFFRDVSADDLTSDARLKQVSLRLPRDYD